MKREIQPHRFNNGFEWKPVPRLGGLATAEQCDAFDRDGFVLMEGVLDAADVAAVHDEIDDFEERKRAVLRERGAVPYDISVPDAITFTELIVGKSEVLKSFATEEVFGRLAADFVGPEVRIYWDQAVYKLPEPPRVPVAPGHGLHVHAAPALPHVLDAPRRRHRRQRLPLGPSGPAPAGDPKHWWTDVGWRCVDDDAGAVPVEARVGDVICFSSLTPHRTGPNVTDEVRKAYILQYCAEGSTAFDPRPQNDDDAPIPGHARRRARRHGSPGMKAGSPAFNSASSCRRN